MSRRQREHRPLDLRVHRMTEVKEPPATAAGAFFRSPLRLTLLLIRLGLSFWSLPRNAGFAYHGEPRELTSTRAVPTYAQRSFYAIKAFRSFVLMAQRSEFDRGGYMASGLRRHPHDFLYDAPGHTRANGLGFELVCPSFQAGADWVVAVRIPVWFVMLACSLPYVLDISRRAGTLGRREQRLCAACGYDIRATGDRCPECGLPITSP